MAGTVPAPPPRPTIDGLSNNKRKRPDDTSSGQILSLLPQDLENRFDRFASEATGADFYHTRDSWIRKLAQAHKHQNSLLSDALAKRDQRFEHNSKLGRKTSVFIREPQCTDSLWMNQHSVMFAGNGQAAGGGSSAMTEFEHSDVACQALTAPQTLCGDRTLPCSSFCMAHIMWDQKQQLFKGCLFKSSPAAQPCMRPLVKSSELSDFCSIHSGMHPSQIVPQQQHSNAQAPANPFAGQSTPQMQLQELDEQQQFMMSTGMAHLAPQQPLAANPMIEMNKMMMAPGVPQMNMWHAPQ